MNNKTEITASGSFRGLKNAEGFYSIIENSVHLFMSTRFDVPIHIDHLQCKGRSHEFDCQFNDCRIISVGSDFDEYLVHEAYIGEDPASFKKNKYTECRFSLTNDIVPFFDTPWEISSPMSNEPEQKISFKSRPDRTLHVEIDENTELLIYIGYSQSYSKIRYKANTSIGFTFKFKKARSREDIFALINGIIDFYSLFCQKRLCTWSVIFEHSPEKYVTYYGDILSKTQKEHFGNLLIEDDQIKEKSETLIPAWIAKHQQNKIALDLIRDAQDLNDEQLRFICLMRCLEIFHKENYSSKKPPGQYLEKLHEFIIEKNLSDISLTDFKKPKEMTLSQRIYDLARTAYENIKKDRLMFGYITLKNRCQQLADTRNYYIHFSESTKSKAWSTDTLAHVNFELNTFIKVLFLKHFGFGDETIKSIIVSIKGKYFC